MAEKTGYKLKAIYKVDASRRSTKLNAFAAGYGKTKTIGLFDTMIEKMDEDEIIFVLAHEIGHAKKHHILKSAPLGLLSVGIMLVAAYFLVTMPEASQAFGFAGANMAFGIYIVAILLSPVMQILQIPENVLSRKYEYEADAYGKALTSSEAGVLALKTLYRESFGNLTPHPFVVMMEYSHPPLSQRVSALENNA
jgi:STE24 endopeptidase